MNSGKREGLLAALDELGQLALEGPLADYVGCAFSRVRLRAARVEPMGSRIANPLDKKLNPIKGSNFLWRREWDSNPRYGKPYT